MWSTTVVIMFVFVCIINYYRYLLTSGTTVALVCRFRTEPNGNPRPKSATY